jgi:predicted MFS family arabinose efflux permease
MSQKTPLPFIVYILALTNFALTTAEFMVAGMMPSLAAALDVSVGEIGYLISWYALGMAIGGPVLTMLLLALRVPNKPTLLWLLVLYVAGAVLAAAASTYAVMAAGRVIMGVASSACFGVSMSICAGLVAPEGRGRAVSFVLAGLMLAPVFGVPATALIEQHYGWRTSFWSVAVLAMLCTAVVAWRVPASKDRGSVGLGAEFRSLRNAGLWAAYVTSALIIGGTFAAFSYFSPIFIEVTGFSARAIPWLLMLYGLANVCGNIIVGRLADRHTMAVLAGGTGWRSWHTGRGVGCICRVRALQRHQFRRLHGHRPDRRGAQSGNGGACHARRLIGTAGEHHAYIYDYRRACVRLLGRRHSH